MKQKRKKIFARVSALLAVVALVVVLALPTFALDTLTAPNEEQIALFKEYYGIGDTLDAYFEQNPNWWRYKFLIATTKIGTGVRVPSTVLSGYSIEDNTNSNYDMAVINVTKDYSYYFNGAINSYISTSFSTKYSYTYFKQGSDVAVTVRTNLNSGFDTTSSTWTFQTLVGMPYDSTDYVFLVVGGYVDSGGLGLAFDYAFDKDSMIYMNPAAFFSGVQNGGTITEEDVQNAYNDGYNVGYDDGLSQTSLIDGVTALFRAPMEFVNSTLNFEIFGIEMATAVKVLITMAIIGVVVTIVWKAVK